MTEIKRMQMESSTNERVAITKIDQDEVDTRSIFTPREHQERLQNSKTKSMKTFNRKALNNHSSSNNK